MHFHVKPYLITDLLRGVSKQQQCIIPMWSECSRWQYLSDPRERLNNDTCNIVTFERGARRYNVSNATDAAEPKQKRRGELNLRWLSNSLSRLSGSSNRSLLEPTANTARHRRLRALHGAHGGVCRRELRGLIAERWREIRPARRWCGRQSCERGVGLKRGLWTVCARGPGARDGQRVCGAGRQNWNPTEGQYY